MRKKISVLLVVVILFLTGFTVVDYYEYEEPYWVAQEFEIREKLSGASKGVRFKKYRKSILGISEV